MVEDAEHGIQAARTAGMKSIGVSQNGKHLPADIVVRSLDLLDERAFNTCCGMALNSGTAEPTAGLPPPELSTPLLFHQ